VSVKRDRDQPPLLDTQSRSLLGPSPPEEWTESATSGFTLVLLERGPCRDRISRAIDRILREPERSIEPILDGPCPIVVRSGLTLDEAVVGQFELISCDCVSIFLRDAVAARGSSEYLRTLFVQLRNSPEFQPVVVAVSFIPDTDAGRRFCDQFLDSSDAKIVRLGIEIALSLRAFRKKARNMTHWAMESGIRMAIEE
jgi:hypothetical protein